MAGVTSDLRFTFPAAEYHRLWAGTRLYVLVTDFTRVAARRRGGCRESLQVRRRETPETDNLALRILNAEPPHYCAADFARLLHLSDVTPAHTAHSTSERQPRIHSALQMAERSVSALQRCCLSDGKGTRPVKIPQSFFFGDQA